MWTFLAIIAVFGILGWVHSRIRPKPPTDAELARYIPEPYCIDQGAEISVLGRTFHQKLSQYQPGVYLDPGEQLAFAQYNTGVTYYWILPGMPISQQEFFQRLETLPKLLT